MFFCVTRLAAAKDHECCNQGLAWHFGIWLAIEWKILACIYFVCTFITETCNLVSFSTHLMDGWMGWEFNTPRLLPASRCCTFWSV